MKKLTLTIVCAMAVSGAAFAQGYITWAVTSANATFETNTAVSPLFGGTGVGGTVGLTGTAAGGFDYILLDQPQAVAGVAGTDTAVWDGTWSQYAAYNGGSPAALVGTNGTSSLQRGQVLAEATPNGQVGNGVQVNWAAGTTNNIILVGWSANLGSSWGTVSNILAEIAAAPGNSASILAGADVVGTAFFGETMIGYINPSAGTPGTPIFASAADLNGLPINSPDSQLYALPVPEPATMALAGLGGLSLLLFRRKRS